MDVGGFITLIKNNTGLAVNSLWGWSTAVLSTQLRYGKVVLVLLRNHHFRVKLQQSGHISLHHSKVCIFFLRIPVTTSDWLLTGTIAHGGRQLEMVALMLGFS